MLTYSLMRELLVNLDLIPKIQRIIPEEEIKRALTAFYIQGECTHTEYLRLWRGFGLRQEEA